MEQGKQLSTALAPAGVFDSIQGFENAQRMAAALTASDLVPDQYKGNKANALVAMEMAQRTGAGIMAVMQNLHVIQGRPSWSSSFIIAALNSCGMFSQLRFEKEDRGEKSVAYEYWDGPKGQRQKKTGQQKVRDLACRAWALDRATGDRLEGPWVSMEMAVLEGWYTKSDSKWKTMGDLMLMYRAAAFFGRLYAPHVLMGMHADDELHDAAPIRDITPAPAAAGPANDNEPPAAGDGKPSAAERINAGARGRSRQSRQSEEGIKPDTQAAGAVIDGRAEDVTDTQPPAAAGDDSNSAQAGGDDTGDHDDGGMI